MTRALVVTLPERGHYLPFVAPARVLEARGCKTFFTSPADITDELVPLGVKRFVAPQGVRPPDESLRGAPLAAILRDPRALRDWIRQLLVEHPRARLEATRAIVKQLRPDVVIIDTMAYEGAVAAHLEGTPWVGWATSLNPVIPDAFDSELIRTTRWLDDERRAFFAGAGLESRFRVSDVLSPWGTAVFATEALVGRAPRGVHLVGPSLCDRGEPELSMRFTRDRPLVYVSFGSQAWHQPDRYSKLFEALERTGMAGLFAMGDLASMGESQALPPWIRCVRRAPQLQALAHARVSVTHGGANSVMEAMAHGVPMLVSPLCNDQPHNLSFAAASGAAAGMDLDTATPQDIAACLQRLAAPGPERTAVRRVARSYGERNGAEGAAELALAAAKQVRR